MGESVRGSRRVRDKEWKDGKSREKAGADLHRAAAKLVTRKTEVNLESFLGYWVFKEYSVLCTLHTVLVYSV